MNNNKGQTLVELIASIAIFSMVSFAILGFFSFTTNIYYKTIRQDQVLFEHRFIKYACEETIKKAQYYSFDNNGNLIVYKDEENININEYVKEISEEIISFKAENINEVLTISYTIEISNEKDSFRVQMMLPANKV